MADLVSDVVVKLVASDLVPFVSAGQRREISPEAFQAAQDLEGVSADRLAIGATISKDLAEIDERERTGYLTLDQARILKMHAREEARAREESAYAEAKRAYERLGDAIDAELTPKLDASREQMAREELQLAFPPVEQNPEGKALWLAANANDEVVAALLSPYGRTLLQSRSVKYPDPILREVRKTAAARASSRLDTPAARLRKAHYAGLTAVVGGAGSTTRRLAGR